LIPLATEPQAKRSGSGHERAAADVQAESLLIV
jgi:hypothetical protein